MSSQKPIAEDDSEVPALPTNEEAPGAAEVEQPVTAPEEGPPPEEQYEELIEPEKPRKPRKKMKHLGAIITVIVILVILLAWTLFSPKILPPQGTTYTNSSSSYANLANFTGTHESWAATTTWGISVSGPESAQANQTFSLLVLVTKVSEQPKNFWFRGTAITLTNITILSSGGAPLVTMSNKSDPGFGKVGTTVLSLPHGTYNLKVTVQFLVYVDMRIGFLPVEKINLEPLDLKSITVS